MEGGGFLSIKRDPKERNTSSHACMQNETVARYSNTFSTTRCIEMQISLVRARPKATTHVPSLLRQTTLPPHSQPLRCTHAARSATAQQSVPRAAGDLHRESSSASHQSRATNRVRELHLNPTGLVGLPFWQPNGTSRATTFTMGSSTGFVCMQGRDAISGNQHAISQKWEAELHRRDHIGIRALIGVRPPCSTLQRRPPRRSCSW